MFESSMEDNVTSPLIPQLENKSYIIPDYSTIAAECNISPLSGVINQELSPADINVLPTTSGEEDIKVYKRRWYILLLFCLVSFTNGIIYNTWSPISNSVKKVFDWTEGDISLLANWGQITQLSIPLFVMLLDTKGMRWSLLTSILCVTLGAGVRCIPTPQPSTLHKWLIHAGQILNGLGGPVTTLANAALSATWFPPHERATATAIPMTAKFIALAVSFIIGPLLVSDISNQNVTDVNLTTTRADTNEWISIPSYEIEYAENNNNISGVTVKELKEDIAFYLQIQAGLAVAVFLMVLVYFPKKPPTPPSVSASVQREPFLAGLKLLLRKRNIWILVLIAVLACGFTNVWMSVLSLILIPVGASQKEAGWIGFYALLSVGGTTLVTARFGDYFANRMKWFISSLYVLAAAMYLWFALICIKIAPFHIAFLYISVIVGQAGTMGPSPLMIELACDLAYPVGEGTSSGLITGAFMAFSCVLLFVMMIPNIGTMWINWSIVSAMVLSTLLILMVKEKHHRLDIDVTVPEPEDTSPPKQFENNVGQTTS